MIIEGIFKDVATENYAILAQELLRFLVFNNAVDI